MQEDMMALLDDALPVGKSKVELDSFLEEGAGHVDISFSLLDFDKVLYYCDV
jgi:hypothetical protein